jgi:CRP-like cAMP-binding protein
MATLSRVTKRDVLAATPLFATLGREELAALADLAGERRVARGAVVVHRGDPNCALLVLVLGRLRAGAVSAEGREVTVGTMEPGAVFGEIALLDGRPRSLDVVATADSLLLSVERRDFLPFLRARPELMLRLMELLCDRLRRNSTAYEDLALAPLAARLARLLLALADAHGAPTPDGVQIRLALSQRDMAAQVAATRERVNKQLRQWHEAGVLGDQDGRLVLRQPAALRALLA